jgi:cytidylate kinase
MPLSPFIIAIDGPSASGKGTIAKRLAAHFDFAYLDTGLLYRAVGLSVLRSGSTPTDPAAAERAARALSPEIFMNIGSDKALREDVTAQAASQVAAIPGVRQALLQFQKDFCTHPPGGKKGAVVDGRDIGTVIAPMPVLRFTLLPVPKPVPSVVLRSCRPAAKVLLTQPSSRTCRCAMQEMQRARLPRQNRPPMPSFSIPRQ